MHFCIREKEQLVVPHWPTHAKAGKNKLASDHGCLLDAQTQHQVTGAVVDMHPRLEKNEIKLVLSMTLNCLTPEVPVPSKTLNCIIRERRSPDAAQVRGYVGVLRDSGPL